MTKMEACFNLRSQGLKYREIAERVGIKLGAVSVHLAHAKQRLAEGRPLSINRKPLHVVVTPPMAGSDAWWWARGY